ELLDRFQLTSGREMPSSLRSWLSRALHLDGTPFESARDAQNGLGELEGATVTPELPGETAFAAAPRAVSRLESGFRTATDALLAVVQTAYIGYLLYSPAPAIVIESPQPAALSSGSASARDSVMLPALDPPPVDSTAAAAKALEPAKAAASASRSGGVRLISQI